MNKYLLIFTSLFCVIFAGCMSKYEYKLRQQDMTAKASHPAFAEIRIKGPLQIDKDGELVIPYPNQPYNHTPIPDGQAIQANVINKSMNTAAVVTGFMYGVHSAKGNTTVNNVSGGNQ